MTSFREVAEHFQKEYEEFKKESPEISFTDFLLLCRFWHDEYARDAYKKAICKKQTNEG